MIRWRNILILLVMFLAMVSSAFAATTGKISGTITDGKTGDPLPGVNVVIEGTVLGAMTDLDGNYFIINVPVGTHRLRVSMMGFQAVVVSDVVVNADLTTLIDQELNITVIESGVAVVVVAKRAMINKSMTASMTIMDAEMMETMPTEDVQSMVALSAGVVEDGGAVHMRGGRGSEVVYMVDGQAMVDPLTGQMSGSVPDLAIKETAVTTGGMGAEYGNAQSGIVNIVTREGSDEYNGKVTYRMNLFPKSFMDKYDFVGYNSIDTGNWVSIEEWENDGFTSWKRKTSEIKYFLSGPVPLLNRMIRKSGNLSFFLSNDYNDYRGSFLHSKGYSGSVLGKLTYKTKNGTYKLNASFLGSWYAGSGWSNLWRRQTSEDGLERFKDTGWDTVITYFDDGTERDASEWDLVNNNSNYIIGWDGNPWYDNGKLDKEDLNGDNYLNTIYREDGNIVGDTRIDEAFLDPSAYPNANVINGRPDINGDGIIGKVDEDLNKNNALDSEDLNSNGSTDVFNMLEHRPKSNGYDTQFGLTWTHTISKNTYYEFKIGHNTTYSHFNVEEKINEDRDGDGHLDYFDAALYPNGENVDVNGDGYAAPHEWVDINGDGNYDPRATEDLNGNGILDVYGTDLFRDDNHNNIIDASEGNNEMGWAELPFGNARDTDGFYTYGNGLTYNRSRWNEETKQTSSVRFDLTSQLNHNHQAKTGFEIKYFQISAYDVDLASGGNVYGEDYTVFPHAGGAYIQDKMEFEGLIVNAGMRLDYFDPNYDNYPSDINDPVTDITSGGEIKNPTSVPMKFYWSPRLGVSHPITDRDKLHFTYGRYFQIPMLNVAFRNLNFDFSGAFPLIGNTNIEPERTTAYEIGVDHQFDEVTLISFTGFYKDITGLTDTKQVYYTATDWYGLYYNTDYADNRGFEISFTRMRTNYWSSNINYTYSVSKGKSSGSRQGYQYAWAGDIEPTTDSYLDWDQRHTIAFNLGLYLPRGENWGIPHFDDWSISNIVTYGSGKPFSPPSRSRTPEINTRRLPITWQWDTKIIKRFHFGRFTPSTFLNVQNITDRKNVTGIADAEWYTTYDDPSGRYNNPAAYGGLRTITMGFGLEF